ncbi:MAG: hypothetical protein AAF635_10010 [Cyanobacteria bacterium P01_C01_bin.69]
MKLTKKQREHLSRPRPVLFCIIIGLLCAPWMLLFGIDAYLRHQQIQTELQAKAFFSQIPTHTSNASAEQVDRLGAQLGLGPNVGYTTPVALNRNAATAFSSIEPALNEFLYAQSGKASGPLDPLPPKLANFISTHQLEIDQLQRYLLEHEPPQWEMDSDRMSDPTYPPPGFFNIRSLQKILLLSALQAHQQSQPTKVFDILEASWQLNKTVANRSDLSSQVLVAVISSQRASILRHLDNVPPQWQSRLQSQLPIQPIMKGVVFETWLRYRIKQNAWIPTAVASTDAGLAEKFRVIFANRFSAQSYFKLISLDSTQTAHRALDNLNQLNICTTPQIIAERQLANVKTASWNRSEGISAEVVAKRWQTAGMRSLSLELSLHVIQLKSHLETTGAWPTDLQPISSQFCPGEQWHYTSHPDGSISLSFSQKFLSPSAVPLTYRSAPPNRQNPPPEI